MKFIARSREPRDRSRGQVLVLFAGAALVLFAMMAVVIDVSWLWVNTLKVQRAADAAALAGVVWLPGDKTTAGSTARMEAAKNGYTDLSGGVTITAVPATSNNRRLNVSVSAPVGTFFMKAIGISQVTVTRDAHAEFVLPVPMGSPENYYGVFGLVRGLTTTAGTASAPGAQTNLPDANLKGPLTACVSGAANCFQADGSALNPRGFWATMNTEGAENVNGDAHQPYYDTRTGKVSPPCATDSTRACYDPLNYYNYAIEMPPGSTNGSVYIYDPVFCAVANNKGTGDRWFSGTAGVSTVFELYNTNNQIYNNNVPPQTLLATSQTAGALGTALFNRISASDTTMGGPALGSGMSQCRTLTTGSYSDSRDYHNKWWRLYSGLTGGAEGTIYRLHTTTTEPAFPAQQKGTDGESSFAVYAAATGGTPRVYGLGAMQMFTPLSASGGTTASEFYLAQIDREHAGKSVEIMLWDPGDTNPLSAYVQIERPSTTTGVWTPATDMSYTAIKGTNDSDAVNCNVTTPIGPVSQITTATPTSKFNGCWVTINVPIPSGYTAPQDGWWKIKYTMNGTGTSNDVTTWKVAIRGNPVHLTLP